MDGTAPPIQTPAELDPYVEPIAEELHDASDNAQPWKFHTYDDILAEPPKRWLVRGLIGLNDLVLVYGHGKAGKTIVVFDLVGALIEGWCDFADRFSISEPVAVVYATGEGQGGLSNRLRALSEKWAHGAEARTRLQILKQVPQLYQSDSPLSIRNFADSYAAEFGTRLSGGVLILDTLARASVGAEENSARDTTVLLEAINYARERLGCTIVAVHHSNKGPSSAHGADIRGSSNLLAGFDNAIYVRKDTEGNFCMGSDVAKDAGDIPDILFRFRVHEWRDADGIPSTSVSIQWTGARTAKAMAKHQHQAEIVQLLRSRATYASIATHPDQVSRAMTARQVHEALEAPPTIRMVRAHLQSMRQLDTSGVQGIARPEVDNRGRSNKAPFAYYFVDPDAHQDLEDPYRDD